MLPQLAFLDMVPPDTGVLAPACREGGAGDNERAGVITPLPQGKPPVGTTMLPPRNFL